MASVEKERALLDWLNALDLGHPVRETGDLHDGGIFLSLIEQIEPIKLRRHCANTAEAYRIIVDFLDAHLASSSQQLDVNAIIHKADGLELLKVCYLMLVVCFQCEYNLSFVNAAMGLSHTHGLHIKQMAEAALLPGRECRDLATFDWPAVLCKSLEPEDIGMPMESSTPCPAKLGSMAVANSLAHTPDGGFTPTQSVFTWEANNSILGKFASPQLPSNNSNMSPVIKSPQFKCKVMLRQKDQFIKKLERSLNSERHLREDLSVDLQNKEQELCKLRLKIQDVTSKNKDLRNLQHEVEEIKPLEEELQQREQELVRARRSVKELQTVADRYTTLENELSDVYREKESLQDQLDYVKEAATDLQTQCQAAQEKESTLRTTCEQQRMALVALREELDSALTEKVHFQQLYNEKTREVQEQLSQSIGGQGESMGVILEKQLFELQRDKQNIQAQLEQMEARFRQSANDLQVSSAQNQHLQQKLQQYHRELNDARQSHDTLQQDLTALDTEHQTEKAMMQEQLDQAQSLVRAAKEQAQHRQLQHEAQTRQLQQQLHEEQQIKASQDQELERQQMELEGAQEEVQETRERSQQQIQQLEGKLQHTKTCLKETQESYMSELASIQKKHSEGLEGIKQQHEVRFQQLAGQHQQDITQMSQQLDHLRQGKEKELEQAKLKVESLTEQVSEMQTQLQDAQSAIDSKERRGLEQQQLHRLEHEKWQRGQQEQQETVQQVQKENTSLSSQVVHLEEQVALLNRQVEGLTKQEEDLNQNHCNQLEKIKNDLRLKTQANIELEVKLEKLGTTVEERDVLISDLEGKLGQSRSVVKSQEENQACLSSKIEELTTDLEAKTRTIETSREELHSTKQLISVLKSQLEQVAETEQINETSRQALSHELEKYKTDMERKTQFASDLEVSLAKSKVVIESKSLLISDLHSKIEAYQSAVQTHEETTAGLTSKLEELEATVAAQKLKLQTAEKELENKQQLTSELQSQLDVAGTVELSKQELALQLEQCKSDLQLKTHTASELECRLQEFERTVDSKAVQITDLEGKFAESLSVIKTQEEAHTCLTLRFEDLQADFVAKEQTLQALATEIKKLKAEVEGKNQTLRITEEELESKRQLMSVLQSQLNQVSETGKINENVAQALNQELEKYRINLKQKSQLTGDLETELCELKEVVESKSSQISVLQSKVEEYQSVAQTHEKNTASLTSKLEELEMQLTASKQRLHIAEKEVECKQQLTSELQSRLVEAGTSEEVRKDLAVQLEKYKTMLQHKAQEASELEKYNIDLKQKTQLTSDLETELCELKEVVESKSSQISDLQSKVEEYQSVAQTREQNTASLTSKLKDLALQLEKYKTKLLQKAQEASEHETRSQEFAKAVDSKNGHISNLEGKLAESCSAIKSHEEAHACLVLKLEGLKSDNAAKTQTLKTTNEALQNEKENNRNNTVNLQRGLEEKTIELTNLKRKIQQYQTQRTNDKTKIQKLSAQILDLQQKNQESKKLRLSLGNLEAKYEAAKAALDIKFPEEDEEVKAKPHRPDRHTPVQHRPEQHRPVQHIPENHAPEKRVPEKHKAEHRIPEHRIPPQPHFSSEEDDPAPGLEPFDKLAAPKTPPEHGMKRKLRSATASQHQKQLRGMGSLFMSEDEKDEMETFEWDRLHEMQRRNTLCLPHLRTTYPVETQTCPTKTISEAALANPPEPKRVLRSYNHMPEEKTGNIKVATVYTKGSVSDTMLKNHEKSHTNKWSQQSHLIAPSQPETRTTSTRAKPSQEHALNDSTNSHMVLRPMKTPYRSSRKTTPLDALSCLGTPLAMANLSLDDSLEMTRSPKHRNRTPKNAMNSSIQSSGGKRKNSKRESTAFSIGFTPNKKIRRLGLGKIITRSAKKLKQGKKPLQNRN